ncbi:MAG: DUF2987 domain-containing protein [Glaciecola sp.]
MKRLMAVALGIVSIVMASHSHAEQLTVEYKSFYSHVRKLSSEDTQALQFAFGFINIRTKSLCTINEARISTDKQQIPLQVTPEGRFTVPSEKALKLADALIIIDLKEAANICDMSVQLETTPDYLKTQYTQQELSTLYKHYETFFDDMGGFMAFMMPKVDGLNIVFAEKLNTTLNSGQVIENGKLFLSANDINALSTLDLPLSPLRITANTTK